MTTKENPNGRKKIITEDLKEGKTVVRQMHHNQMKCRNVRDDMKNMSNPQPCKCQVGVGAATTRTAKQKIKAY